MLLTEEKKKQLVKDYEAYWQRTLERPIINVTLTKESNGYYNPNVAKADLLKLVYDLNVPVSTIVEKYREYYENQIYLGDGFPVFYFRPTSCLGAMIDEPYSFDEPNGTIWFEEIQKDIHDIHIELHKESPIYQRALQLYDALSKEFGDDVAFGVPDFGGVMDIYASIRTSNGSMMDFYDNPEELIRINDELFAAYKEAYKDFMAKIRSNKNLGYTAWITLLSQEEYNVVQCDSICMVSKKMAEKFILPNLKNAQELTKRTFYHLDGPQAVKHLDALLEIPFDGIQWVNGAGSAPYDDESWTDIYRKTIAAGKLLQISIYSKDELRFIDHLYKVLGTLKGVSFMCYGNESDKEYFEQYLEKYGASK